MIRKELPPPEGNYRRAKLLVSLGPLVPVGRVGWLSEEVETIDEQGNVLYRFVSATNHDMAFKVYLDEVAIE